MKRLLLRLFIGVVLASATFGADFKMSSAVPDLQSYSRAYPDSPSVSVLVPAMFDKEDLILNSDRILVRVDGVWRPWLEQERCPDLQRGIAENVLGDDCSISFTSVHESFVSIIAKAGDGSFSQHIVGWNGALLCDQSFSHLFPINDEEIFVDDGEGGCFFMSPNGTRLSEVYVRFVDPYGRYHPFSMDGKSWGILDEQRKVLLEPQEGVVDIGYFSECGLARFKSAEGLYGYLDTRGKIVVPANFKYASNFQEGVAVVSINKEKDKNDRFFIDAAGNRLFPNISFSSASSFSHGVAVIHKRIGFKPGNNPHERYYDSAELIDLNGRRLSMGRFKSIDDPDRGWPINAMKARSVVSTKMVGDESVPVEWKDVLMDFSGKVWDAGTQFIPLPEGLDKPLLEELVVKDGDALSAEGNPLQCLAVYDQEGEIQCVCEPRYESLSRVALGVYRFKEGGKYGFLRVSEPSALLEIHEAPQRLPLAGLSEADLKKPSFEVIIPPSKDNELIFHAEGSVYITIKNAESWSVLNEDGDEVIPFGRIPAEEFGMMGPIAPYFPNPDFGYMVTHIEEEKMGFFIIDSSGRRVIERPFAKVKPIGRNQFWVDEMDGACRIIDERGDPLTADYKHMSYFNEDRACIIGEGKKNGLMDRDFNVLLPPRYPLIDDFSEGLALYRNDEGLYGYLGLDGQVAIEARFKDADHFYHGIAQVSDEEYQQGDYYFINAKGEELFDGLRVSQRANFKDGFATVRITRPVETAPGVIEEIPVCGVMDTQGQFLVPCLLESLASRMDYTQKNEYSPVRSGSLLPSMRTSEGGHAGDICVDKAGRLWKSESSGVLTVTELPPVVRDGDPFYMGLMPNRGRDESGNLRYGLSLFTSDGLEHVIIAPQFDYILYRISDTCFVFYSSEGKGVLKVLDPGWRVGPKTEMLSPEALQEKINRETEALLESLGEGLSLEMKAGRLYEWADEKLQTYQSTGKLDELYLALNLCGQAIQVDGSVAEYWFLLGAIHSEMARFNILRANEYAMDAYRVGLKLAPDDPARIRLAIREAGAGEYKAALDDFEKAVADEPLLLTGTVLQWMQLCYLEGAQTLRGLEFTDQLLESSPENIHLRLNRITLHLAHFDLKGAESELQRMKDSEYGIPDMIELGRAQIEHFRKEEGAGL